MSRPRLTSTAAVLDLCDRVGRTRKLLNALDVVSYEAYAMAILETPDLVEIDEVFFDLILGSAGFDTGHPDGLERAVAIACCLAGTDRITLTFEEDDPSPLAVRYQQLEHDAAFADGVALVEEDAWEIAQRQDEIRRRLKRLDPEDG